MENKFYLFYLKSKIKKKKQEVNDRVLGLELNCYILDRFSSLISDISIKHFIFSSPFDS